MAEKPRLKETDEILSSIGKSSSKQPSILPPGSQDVPQAAQAKEAPLIGSVVDASTFSARPASSHRAQPPIAEPVEDHNPLDFGKYQLPNLDEPGAVVPGPRPNRRRARLNTAQAQAQAQEESAPPGETPTAPVTPPVPLPLGEDPVDSPARQPAPAREKPPKDPSVAAQKPSGQSSDHQPVVKDYHFEVLDSFVPTESPAALEPTPEKAPPAAKPKGKPASEPDPEPSTPRGPRASLDHLPPPEPEELPQAPSRNAHRENFLKRLSSQFEQEFTQKFQEEPPQRAISDVAWFDTAAISPKAIKPTAIPLLPEEDRATDVETEKFFQQFEQQVRQEEQAQAETFKDTLAEKFQRERERYLRELGIDTNAPPAPPPRFEPPESNLVEDFDFDVFTPSEASRRRLDMQIQPEMHMRTDENPMRPVTYNRSAAAFPQEDVGDALPYILRQQDDAPPFIPPVANSKAAVSKSSEQLLLELAAQNSLRAHRTPSSPAPKKQAKLLQFRFSDEEAVGNKDDGKHRDDGLLAGNFRKIVAVTTAVALIALAMVAGPLAAGWIKQIGNTGSSESESSAIAALSQDTVTIYESRRPDTRETYSDALIKKANISVQNITVTNHLVIGEIETKGEILLGDVSVGGAIYVRSCAVDFVQLRDVTAPRVIINNDRARVTVEVSGNSNIGSIEIKTPGEIRQISLTTDALGIESVLAQAANPDTDLNLKLDGVKLHSLVTIGDNAVALAGGTTVTSLTAEGAIALTGDGNVVNMAAAAGSGEAQADVRIRDTTVANLLLKSPAKLDISNNLDTVAASESLSVLGGGIIGTMTLSPQFNNKRMPIDLTDINVSTLVSNAQAKVNLAGTSKVALLTCNDSVYALGNKVNHLMVNANNVIYEREPDKITVAPGVRPPGTVADNPNLDYSLTTAQNTRDTDLSGDDVATTCNHPRESGGFIVGDGSRDNPFQVSSAAQLAHINGHLSSHFIQNGNIDIAQDSQFASGFNMIASGGSPFTGVYDGDGSGISGLRIRSDAQNVGLFAENSGTIRSLHILSGDISASSTQRSYVGAVAGINFDGGIVESCSNGATVSGNTGAYVGGIAGYNYSGKIRDCYNYAKISGVSNTGGISGVNRENATISNSYNAGAVDAQMDSGAVVGVNTSATVANCYYLLGTSAAGIGSGTGNAVEKTGDQLSESQMAKDLAAGNEASLWTSPSSGSNYTFPILGAPPLSGPQVNSSGSSGSGDESSRGDSEPVEVDPVV